MRVKRWIAIVCMTFPLFARASDCDKAFEKELVHDPHRMEKGRGLERYQSDSFKGAPFREILRELPKNFLIVENGAGKGAAAIDILNDPELSKSGRIVLVDRVKPQDQALANAEKIFGGRLEYLADKTIEERIGDGSLSHVLGQADVAIGSYASETYVPGMRETIGKNLLIPKVGGKYVFNVVWMSISANPHLMTTIRPANRQGEEGDYGDIPFQTFREWLKQIKGAKLVHFSNSGFNDINYIAVLERTGQTIEMPPLELKLYEMNYAPPRRLYIAPTVTIP